MQKSRHQPRMQHEKLGLPTRPLLLPVRHLLLRLMTGGKSNEFAAAVLISMSSLAHCG